MGTMPVQCAFAKVSVAELENLWKSRFGGANSLNCNAFAEMACGVGVTLPAPCRRGELFSLPPQSKPDSFVNGERDLG